MLATSKGKAKWPTYGSDNDEILTSGFNTLTIVTVVINIELADAGEKITLLEFRWAKLLGPRMSEIG